MDGNTQILPVGHKKDTHFFHKKRPSQFPMVRPLKVPTHQTQLIILLEGVEGSMSINMAIKDLPNEA